MSRWFTIRTEMVQPLDKNVGPKMQVVLSFPGLIDDIRMTPGGAAELGMRLWDYVQEIDREKEVPK